MLYTSKGLASVFAGFGAATLAARFGGSFAGAFNIAAAVCLAASLLAVLVLRPLLSSRIAKETDTDLAAPKPTSASEQKKQFVHV